MVLAIEQETRVMTVPPSRIEAHRGASHAFPENTMLAFAKAKEAGARSIETDLSLLADGGLAVFHDAQLGRTVAGDAAVGDLTGDAISQMDAGAWHSPEFAGETVPLLDDLLDWQMDTGMRFNLEMKCHGARQGEAASALAAQMTGCDLSLSMVSSFDPAFLAGIMTTLPGLPRALISETLPDDWKETASRLKLSALHLNHEVVNAAMVEEIHKTGLVVRVYTVNEEEDMDHMLAAGVDVMITDKPEAFL